MEACRLHGKYVYSLFNPQHALTDLFLASCPKCDHGRAYFYMLQIRSADEPMTTCTCTAVPPLNSLLTKYPIDSLSVCMVPCLCSIDIDRDAAVQHAETTGEKTRHYTFGWLVGSRSLSSIDYVYCI